MPGQKRQVPDAAASVRKSKAAKTPLAPTATKNSRPAATKTVRMSSKPKPAPKPTKKLPPAKQRQRQAKMTSEAAVKIAVGKGAKASDRESTLKTRVSEDASVGDFINKLESAVMREDCVKMIALMRDITGEPPKLWGGSTVGFGSFNYASQKSKCAGDWMLTGFSPRKSGISLQLMCGFKHSKIQALLAKLGPHTTTMACLKPCLSKGQSVAEAWDWAALRQIIKFSVDELKSGRVLRSS